MVTNARGGRHPNPGVRSELRNLAAVEICIPRQALIQALACSPRVLRSAHTSLLQLPCHVKPSGSASHRVVYSRHPTSSLIVPNRRALKSDFANELPCGLGASSHRCLSAPGYRSNLFLHAFSQKSVLQPEKSAAERARTYAARSPPRIDAGTSLLSKPRPLPIVDSGSIARQWERA